MIVDDFKNSKGLWVKEVAKTGNIRNFTRSAIFYWNMMSRCVKGGSQQVKRPRYAGVECLFKDFQEFAEWCQYQVGYYTNGFQLDKDLLSENSKIYSPETCVFIPIQLNTLLIKRDSDRGEYPVGVCAANNNFMAQCSVGKNRQEYLGVFATPEGAFQAYKTFKEGFVKQQANKWKEQIDPRAYQALMDYEVLITD